MGHSTFMNASGLPDPDQWTTARDLAILSRRLINDFPGYYRYFSTPSFAWHRQVIFNHDNMLRTYPGADGLKTGYTEASGHNLVTSAVRGGVRLVGVVLGAASNGERDIHMASLLDHGFEQMDVPAFQQADPDGISGDVDLNAPMRRRCPRPSSLRGHAANWAVQVGTYATESAAHGAAATARRDAEAGEVRIEPIRLRARTVWRAQVTGSDPGRCAGRMLRSPQRGLHGDPPRCAAGCQSVTG